MIIIPCKKFVFLRVPRTASTSLSHFIGQNVSHFEDMKHTPVYYADYYTDKSISLGDVNSVHDNLDQIVHKGLLTFDEAINFRVFAVMRDPVQRFISTSCLLNNNKEADINQIVELQLEQLADPLKKKNGNFRPQTHWIKFNNKQISDIFCYENLNSIIKEMWSYLNIQESSELIYKHRVNERKDKISVLDSFLANKIKSMYNDDVEIHQKLLRQNER